MIFLVVLGGISIAAIAAWSVVASVQIIARSRGQPPGELVRDIMRLEQAIADLREELEAIENKEERDVLALEERIDFTERLLTQRTERTPQDN